MQAPSKPTSALGADPNGRPSRFKDQVVIVVGGARGIGGATAEAFAREDAKVVVADVLEENGAATVERITSSGGVACFRNCDVSSSADVKALIAFAVTAFGGIDVLFNNVGIVRYGKVDELSEDDWDVTLRTNLSGMFYACKYAIPEMRKRGGGAIVNTASALAHGSQPLTSSYAASKGGILALTRTIAIDYARERIRCNSISPGTINTPIVQIAAKQIDAEHSDRLIASWGEMHPLGRIGEPEEVANLVLFLASHDAEFITGSDYAIDGGIRASLVKE